MVSKRHGSHESFGSSYQSPNENRQPATKPVTGGTSHGGTNEGTASKDRHDSARFILGGFVELSIEGWRGNDLSNDTEIVTVQQRAQGCKQTHEELVYFWRERHGDCRRSWQALQKSRMRCVGEAPGEQPAWLFILGTMP